MNNRVVLLGLPVVLLVAVVAGIGSLPQAHAQGFPSGPGTLCLLDPSAVPLTAPGPCASLGPYTFNGPFPSAPQTGPTQLRVGVYVNGSAALIAFDIILVTNSAVLQPAGIDTTGTILNTPAGSPTLVVECVGGVLVSGSTCGSTDPGSTELALATAPGGFVTAPATGLLFTAMYNIVSSAPAGGVPIGFQTGCSTSSVSGNVCVTVANGTATPVPETVQTGTIFDNSSCSTTCTIPWLAISTGMTTVTVPKGTSTGNNVELIASAENGWPFISTDSVSFTATASPGFAAPTFTGSNMCATGGASCNVNISLSTAIGGTYSVAVQGTYVATDSTPTGAGSGKTDTLVGTTVIVVNVQAVSWTINSVGSSSPQTLYMAQGVSNPMSLFFTVKSLGGYSGTISFGTGALSDAGTGLTFSYPAAFALGSGQTITQTITATASSYGTGPAIYQATLFTSAPTLVNQSSAVLTVHMTGISLAASPSTVSFSAGTSGTLTLTLQGLPASAQGFGGKVTLVVKDPGPIGKCPASLTLTAGGMVSGTCTFSGATPGSYPGTITATGGTNGDITNSTAITVVITSSTASFNVNASPPSVSGQVNTTPTSSITVVPTGGFSGTVTLSESSTPSGLSCTFSATGVPVPPSGTRTLSCSSSTPTIYTVTVTGTSGSHTNSTSVTFTFTDFSLSATSPAVTTTAGLVGASTITIAPINAFTGTVTLSSIVSPPGLVCSLSPSTIILGGPMPSTLACSGPAGAYTVSVTGVSGPISHAIVIPYNVLPATPSLTTTIINAAGAPVTSVNTGIPVLDQATLSGGFPATGITGTVSYTFYPNGNCATPGVSAGTVPVGPGNSVGPSNTFTPTTAGLYSFSATYSGDENNNPVTSSCELLTVSDYTVVATPTTLTVFQGGSDSSIVTVASLEGFTGNVTLTVSSTGPTATISPAMVLVPASGSSTAALTVSVGSTFAPSSYSVTVTGTGSGLSHSTTLTINVLTNTAPYFVSPSLPALHWTHHLSLSRSSGQQTYSATVFNPASNNWYVELAVSGSSDTGVPFTGHSTATLVGAGASIPLTFNVSVSPAYIGSRVSFTVTLIYGTSPTSLPFASPLTRSGSFTVVA